ncbi:hypothetical protein [Candidatus Velamenicoccus archaeovorus]|uniref:hypothetical protein n=1 Tax=Velamenicoccus archaeovorus TaxID=1930593 RepID=UPI001E2A08CD|nr:hypothetical protein [Candidatus Velamenicoccus archaeovorus]
MKNQKKNNKRDRKEGVEADRQTVIAAPGTKKDPLAGDRFFIFARLADSAAFFTAYSL